MRGTLLPRVFINDFFLSLFCLHDPASSFAHRDEFFLAQHAVLVRVEQQEATAALGLIGKIIEKLRQAQLAVVVGVPAFEDGGAVLGGFRRWLAPGAGGSAWPVERFSAGGCLLASFAGRK